MAISPKLSLRFPQPLLDAAEKRAAEQDLGLADYIRGLVEVDTGTRCEVLYGFQHFSQAAMKRAMRASLRTRRKKKPAKS